MNSTFSIGGQFFDGSRSTELYRVLSDEVQRLGVNVVTCTIAAGDEGERLVWEQLGADFKDAGHGRLYPVLQLSL